MGFLSHPISPDDLDDELRKFQRTASIFLYISLIAHGLDIYLSSIGMLEGLVSVMEVVSAISAIVFFLAECLLLPPVGILAITVISTLLAMAVPYFVAFLVRSFIESLVLLVIGGFIMVCSVGLVVIVVNGVVVGAVITPLIVTPLLAGFGAIGATALVGAGTTAAVDAGLQQVRPADLIRPRRVLINLLLLLVLVWPALTWTGVFQGVFALKPVQRAHQEYLAFSEEKESLVYKQFFEPQENGSYTLNGTQNWTFDEGFYNTYIYPGRNTFAQGATPAASTDTHLAFCLNGMVYLTDVENNELYHATAYDVKREDAMVMVSQEAFLFCHNRIALLGPKGRYLWKDTNWTSDFKKLSDEAQYDRLYAILESQNDGKAGAVSIEDVAVVAYAQRNGLLLYYDSENHCAYFGQEGKKDQITILRQNAPGDRSEAAVFTPNCSSQNMPYSMINGDVLAYIDGADIVFLGVNDDWSNVRYTNKIHNEEQHSFVSLHILHDAEGNEYFAYQDSEDAVCLELLEHYVFEATFNSNKYDAVYSVGSYIYGIVYDSDDLLNTFTYVQDLTAGQGSTDVWTENWGWERIRLHKGLWDDETAEQPEETTQPEEKTFAEQYPIPELRTSVRQIGLYKENLTSPSQYAYYRGPVSNFNFRFPRILYEEVEYQYSEDGTEVQIRFYCVDEPSSLTVTLRPNADGTDHSKLLPDLQKSAEAEMINVLRMRSGNANQEGTASTFYLTGNSVEDPGMICTKLCWLDNENIMEMELLIPNPTNNEDKAYKDYYIQAMYACCGFGSGKEPPVWWKFKSKYGL